MRISKKAEYAIHTVLYLCVHSEKSHQLERLAQMQGVSKDYLAKVMQALSKNGVVSAQPGVGGGYKLEKEPKNISFAEVVRPFEFTDGVYSCLHSKRGCEAYPDCGINAAMSKAVSKFYEELEKTSFADLLTDGARSEYFPSWLGAVLQHSGRLSVLPNG